MAADLHPRIVAAQRELLEAAGAHAARIGWKVGHDIPEVCELAGAQPVVGCLTAATLLADGATYTAGADVALRGETEVVIELAEAIVADASTAVGRCRRRDRRDR
jgi:2-keto-4-pentenoate hydratase